MMFMQKHWDTMFGFVGAASTAIMTHINTALACVAGLFTVGVMALRFRREWKSRNQPPPED